MPGPYLSNPASHEIPADYCRNALQLIDGLKNGGDGARLRGSRNAIAKLGGSGNGGSRGPTCLILADRRSHAAQIQRGLVANGILESAILSQRLLSNSDAEDGVDSASQGGLTLRRTRDGRIFRLTSQARQWTIGSEDRSDIPVTSHAVGVAPLQGDIVSAKQEGERTWQLRDLNSAQGTWLNGEDIRKQGGVAILQPGDTFVIGDRIQGETFLVLIPEEAFQTSDGAAGATGAADVEGARLSEEEVAADELFVVLQAARNWKVIPARVAELQAIVERRRALLGPDSFLHLIIVMTDRVPNAGESDALRMLYNQMDAHPILRSAVRRHNIAPGEKGTEIATRLRELSPLIADPGGIGALLAQRNRLARLEYHLHTVIREGEAIGRTRNEQARHQEGAQETQQQLEALAANYHASEREIKEAIIRDLPKLKEQIIVESVAPRPKKGASLPGTAAANSVRLYLSRPQTVQKGAKRYNTLSTTEGLKLLDAEEAAECGWQSVRALAEDFVAERMRTWWEKQEQKGELLELPSSPTGPHAPAFPSWDSVLKSQEASARETPDLKILELPAGLMAFLQEARTKIFATAMLGLTLLRYIVNPVTAMMNRGRTGEPEHGPPLLYGLTPQEITERVGLVLVSVALICFLYDQVRNGPGKRRDRNRIATEELRKLLDTAMAAFVRTQVENTLMAAEKRLTAFVREAQQWVAQQTGAPSGKLQGNVFSTAGRGFEETQRLVLELKELHDQAQQLRVQAERRLEWKSVSSVPSVPPPAVLSVTYKN